MKEKRYNVKMTEKEMQLITYAIAGFYNVANREKLEISPEQTVSIQKTLMRWKDIIAKQSPSEIEIVDDMVIIP